MKISLQPLHKLQNPKVKTRFESTWLASILRCLTLTVLMIANVPIATATEPNTGRSTILLSPTSAGQLAQNRDGQLLFASGAQINHENSALEKLGTFIVGLGLGGGTYDSAALSLLRFTPQSILDTSFGNGGTVITPLLPLKNRNSATVTALLKDRMDRSVVIGWRYSPTFLDSNIIVITAARYTTAGMLDPSFGENGIVTTRVDGAYVTQAYGATLDNDGRLLVVAYNGGKKISSRSYEDDWSTRVILLRYTADGILDKSFGSDGIATQIVGLKKGRDFLLYDYNHTKTAGLILDRLGRAVVAAVDGDGSFYLIRFSPDGILDSSFGTAGITKTPMNKNSGISGLSFDSKERLLAVGTSNDSMVLLRYSFDGTLDSTFADGGVNKTPMDEGMRVSAVVQDSNRRLFVVASGNSTIQLSRFSEEGTLDQSFGSKGVIRTQLGQRVATSAGLAIDSKGIPTVAALSQGGVVVLRYNHDGPHVTRFNSLSNGVVE